MNPIELMQIADDFVNRFYAGDILVGLPKRTEYDGYSDVALAVDLLHEEIAEDLAEHINNYVNSKSKDTAQALIRAITETRSKGMIIERESNKAKSKRLEQENIQLKEENTKLQKEIERVNKLNTGLHSVIARFEAKTNKGNNDEMGV